MSDPYRGRRAGGAPLASSGESYAAPAGDIYRLGYLWRIAGPVDIVFHFLSHGRTFPDWWPVFLSAESDAPAGAEATVGSRVRYHVKSSLPYHLYWDVTLTRLERPHLIETDTRVALSGLLELAGVVRFQLAQRGPWVEVRNEQEMRSSRRLPAPLRILAARAFAYNHHRAMRQGGRGLQQAVRAALLKEGVGTARG